MIVLDGGTLLFSPALSEMTALVDRFKACIEDKSGQGNASVPSFPTLRVHFKHTIIVTNNGGKINTIDGEVDVKVFAPIKCADSLETAKLHVFGFSSLTLNRATLDHRLDISGPGRIADIDENGRIRNLQWFDNDEPLQLQGESQRNVTSNDLSPADRSAIESFLAANYAMMQGGDFLTFYNVLPANWRRALDESVPALVEKCPDMEFALFRDSAITFYRSWALHAMWKAEANNASNLQNGFVKEEARDAVLRYSASALAIAQAATADRLLKGNLPDLLSLPLAALPNGIASPEPYVPRITELSFEKKSDGSVIVIPQGRPNLTVRMLPVEGKWVSEYWAACFSNCDSWKTKIDAVKMTPTRRRWLMKNLTVLKGITQAGERATSSQVAIYVDYWAQFAVKMCRSTFFDDSFRPSQWARVYECHRLYAPYPKLSPT